MLNYFSYLFHEYILDKAKTLIPKLSFKFLKNSIKWDFKKSSWMDHLELYLCCLECYKIGGFLGIFIVIIMKCWLGKKFHFVLM